MSENAVLSIKGLRKAYIQQKQENCVIEGLDLEVHEHEFITVLGPSGCGKSTLLRCIAGFEDYEGTITCAGKTVTKPSTERIMVFQDFNQLFPWKTVEKNIQYPLKIQGIKDKGLLKEITADVLKKVDLKGYEKFYPHELSGGMKQRVAIAKALALKPRIILMDEPFAALDAMTRNNLQAELYELYRAENITVIFITHNIQEAICLGTRILLMSKDGRIIIDDKNTLTKPVKPSTPGYGELWDKYSKALYNEKKQIGADEK